jgi:hypothetical protein
MSHFSLEVSSYNAHYIRMLFCQHEAIYETVYVEFQCKRLEILKSLNAVSCDKYNGHKKSFVQSDYSDE